MLLNYRLVRFIMRLIQISLSKLTVLGRENIPPSGSYIVVTNHMSTVDTPLLLISFPVQRWHFFAGEKWQDHWLWGPLMGWLGAIYIDRENVDRAAVRTALEALADGQKFGLAPEGRRSKVGHMQEAKDGAAFLATRANVPILPVGIINSDILWENARNHKRTPVTVNIGKPFMLPDLDRRVRSRDLPIYTEYIMAHIANQLPERYHGVYADSPALAALQQQEDPWQALQTASLSEPHDS